MRMQTATARELEDVVLATRGKDRDRRVEVLRRKENKSKVAVGP